MAWGNPTSHGNTFVETSGTVLNHQITGGNIPVGDVAFAASFSDNQGSGNPVTEHTITDDQSNTWTRIFEAAGRPGAASNTGVTVSLWYSVITTALVSGTDNVIQTLGNAKVARLLSVRSFSPTNDTITVDAGLADTGNGQTPTVVATGLTSAERLWIYAWGHEWGGVIGQVTPDSDFTTFMNLATDTSGGTSAIRCVWGWAVTTGTGQTADPSHNQGADYAIVLGGIRESAGGGSAIAAIAGHRYRLMG